MWFELLLPGIMRLNYPIPLGGTSNHFKTAVLKELNAWDPYNVTEDADLGIRLYKEGYMTAVVDSRTWEEANSRVGNWVRQRSRWIKGYMQTWLVHMLEPDPIMEGNRSQRIFWLSSFGGVYSDSSAHQSDHLDAAHSLVWVGNGVRAEVFSRIHLLHGGDSIFNREFLVRSQQCGWRILAIFAIVWLAEFFIGYYVSHKIGYMHSDAISRVANAFYVLYSGDPHLGAIGRLSRDFTLDKRKHQFIVCFESFFVFVWHEWTE